MRKRLAIGVISSIAMAMTFSGAAMGLGSGPNPSPSGACHGAFADANGNFGWLGPLGGTPGYHDAVGQQPGATGYNNSQGC